MIGEHTPGISTRPGVIHFNGNSGAQAINLAVLWGARRIALFGFDMAKHDGRKHWFGDHPARLDKPSPYTAWLQKFERIAAELEQAGVRVVNCSPYTALRCFPKVGIDEATRFLSDSDAAGV